MNLPLVWLSPGSTAVHRHCAEAAKRRRSSVVISAPLSVVSTGSGRFPFLATDLVDPKGQSVIKVAISPTGWLRESAIEQLHF